MSVVIVLDHKSIYSYVIELTRESRLGIYIETLSINNISVCLKTVIPKL